MLGLMQDWPLTVPKILEHALRYHAEREVVTRVPEGGIERYTYADLGARARRVAKLLRKLGVRRGEVVGTCATNTSRHMEVWYGLMGIGAVCHTLNPRLFAEQLVYICNHAEDRYVFLDGAFVGIAEALAPKCPSVRGFVFLTDRAHMPETELENAFCYEELLSEVDDDVEWCELDENEAAGLCYTSGTTGNPKGVLYSHRSNVLHAMSVVQPDSFGLGSRSVVLPVVPMFHANAWALTFAAPMVGAKLVMPGADLSGSALHELFETEGVTFTAAVPTVWLGLLDFMEANDLRLSSLQRVVIGGSACPRVALEKFEEVYGVDVTHGWGMTEMSPVGTNSCLKAGMESWPRDAQIFQKLKQGRPAFGVEMRVVDDDGKELPRDGKAFGRLLVRGAAIAKGYHKGEGGQVLDAQGFFDTGDVATLDPHGYMQITDRAKDVIKSGGEWISSIELENLAVGHPEVLEAAVIGVPHPKWDERPLLIVVRREGSRVSKAGLLAFMRGKVANWWLPDDVAFVDEIPHTATGKIQKRTLREKFAEHPAAD